MGRKEKIYQELTRKFPIGLQNTFAFLKENPHLIDKEIGTALFCWSCKIDEPKLAKAARSLWVAEVEDAAKLAKLLLYKNHKKQPHHFYRLCEEFLKLPNYDNKTLKLFFYKWYGNTISLSGNPEEPLLKIPALFANSDFCDNIEELHIEHHQISKCSLSALQLPKLKKLSLTHGKLSKIYGKVDHLENLETLDLSHNQLPTVPHSLNSLFRLKELKLDGNPLTKLPKFLEKFGILSRLFESFQSGIPTGQEETFLETLKALPKKGLNRQQITTLFCAAHFCRDKTVREITFDLWQPQAPWQDNAWKLGLQIKLPTWEYKAKLDYVKFLLYFNQIDERVIVKLDAPIVAAWLESINFRTRKKAELQDLNLQTIPDFYFKLWTTSRVDLSGNMFTQMPVKALLEINRLLTLDMSHNLLKQLPNDVLHNLDEVRELNLAHNFFDTIPLALVGLKRLESLDLSHNSMVQLTKELPELPKLQKLNLSFNQLTKIPAEIIQFINLQELDLSYNALGHNAQPSADQTYNYALPLEISYLDELTHLYLSHNQLSKLPPGIGLVEKLKVLDCSHNQFTNIPREVFEAETLEVLDFSYNHIEQIPEDIALLPQLKKVILTENPLTTGALKKARHWRKDVQWVFESKGKDLEVLELEPARRKPGEKALLDDAKRLYKDEMYTEASVYYIQAATLGGYEGLEALGDINLYKLEYYDTAFHWLHKAAKQGSRDAMLNLGWMYNQGLGVETSLSKAAYWYEKAARLGQFSAQYNTALMYQYGRGVKVNLINAVFWYQQAANQGHINAQTNLGWMYSNGKGVAVDKKQAARWYHKAAEKGQVDAQRNLAYMLREGDGIPKNESEAFTWYEKAAKKGDVSASLNLGWMYEHGRGCAVDHKAAFKYYKIAAKAQEAVAQYNMGVMYQLGKGVNANLEVAFSWYKLAAEQGYANAQQKLAEMYAGGVGVNKNKYLAEKWRETYQKSLDEGAKK